MHIQNYMQNILNKHLSPTGIEAVVVRLEEMTDEAILALPPMGFAYHATGLDIAVKSATSRRRLYGWVVALETALILTAMGAVLHAINTGRDGWSNVFFLLPVIYQFTGMVKELRHACLNRTRALYQIYRMAIVFELENMKHDRT